MATMEKDQFQSMTFPMLLMKILSEESNSMTISWLPHGLSFRIHDRPDFLELLTEYERRFMPGRSVASASARANAAKAVSAESQPARTIKWTSFARKLYRWNIVRLSAGPDAGAYCHPKMQRDCPELVNEMLSEGQSARDILKTKKERPVLTAAAPVAVPPLTQFAQANAQAKAYIAAQQQQQQQQAHVLPSPSVLRLLSPSAPIVPALHLLALSSLQEFVHKSNLAAIRYGPQWASPRTVPSSEPSHSSSNSASSEPSFNHGATNGVPSTPPRMQ